MRKHLVVSNATLQEKRHVLMNVDSPGPKYISTLENDGDHWMFYEMVIFFIRKSLLTRNNNNNQNH